MRNSVKALWNKRLYYIKKFHNSSFQDILYVTTNTLTVTMGLIKICIILMHKREFISLITYTQRNFWNVNYDTREKEILKNCRKTCTFFVCSVSAIGICAMLAYLSTPLISRLKIFYLFIMCCLERNTKTPTLRCDRIN